MANINEIKARLSAIGDAIRDKRNETELYRLSAMPEKIRGIVSGGGTPIDDTNFLLKAIKSDGTKFNDTGYIENVRVDDSGVKAVSSGIDVELYTYCVTGYLPVSVGDTWEFSGMKIVQQVNGNYADSYYAGYTLVYYDASFNALYDTGTYGAFTRSANDSVVNDGNVTKFTFNSVSSSVTGGIEAVSYIRFGFLKDGEPKIVKNGEVIPVDPPVTGTGLLFSSTEVNATITMNGQTITNIWDI